MLRADAVVGASQPCFEIGEHEMDDGQKGFRDFHVAPLRDGGMTISAFPKRRITAPIVGNNGGTRHHGAFDEACQRLGASVRHHGEADAPSVTPGLSFVEAAGTLVLADFDGACHEHHVVDTAPFAPRASTNPGFVGLDGFVRLAADPVLVGTHHADTQLVKNLESGFVARQPELALELDSRHAGRLAGNKVRTPKPNRKRRVRAFHDRASGKTGVAATMTATKHLEARRNVSWLISHRAVRADEAIPPSGTLKILCASGFVWEQALKLRKRVRERKCFSLIKSGLGILSRHGLTAYDPKLVKGKAEEGEVRLGLEFLGCNIRPGMISPTRKSRERIISAVKQVLDKCLVLLDHPEQLWKEGLTAVETLADVSNILKGWGNQYAFCNDREVLKAIDLHLNRQIENYWKAVTRRYSKFAIIKDLSNSRRLLGVHLLTDSKFDPIIDPLVGLRS